MPLFLPLQGTTMPITIEESIASVRDKLLTFSNTIKSNITAQSGTRNFPEYNTAYFTGKTVSGRRLMTIRFNFGKLPNATTKALLIPTAIRNVWGPASDHWIDVAQSYVYRLSDGSTYSLPSVSPVELSGWGSWIVLSSDQISIRLTSQEIIIETQTNRTDCSAIISVCYLEPVV